MRKAYETAGWNRHGRGWRIHYFKKDQIIPICETYGGGQANEEHFAPNFLRSLTSNMFCKSCAKKRKVPK